MAYEFDLKKQKDAFWNSPLDEDEQWLEDHADGFVPCSDQVEMRRNAMAAAASPAVIRHADGSFSEAKTVRKPVTFRMDIADIDRIKQMAMEQGLKYQSLVGSILHRYVTGTLVDISEARKVLSI